MSSPSSQRKKRRLANSSEEGEASEIVVHHATPRENCIKWDQFFMGFAFLARQRSKDPEYQVGACIINEDKKIVGVGYNGMPIGISDNDLSWGKGNSSPLDNKFFYVCHAESNAIVFRNSVDVKGCTLYTTLYPCNECAKVIIQSGIAKVIYFSDEKQHKDEFKAAKIMLQKAKVTFKEYGGDRDTIDLEFSTANLADM